MEERAEPHWFGKDDERGFREKFEGVRTGNFKTDIVGVTEAEN